MREMMSQSAEVVSLVASILDAFRDVPRGLSIHQAAIAKWADSEALAQRSQLDHDHHWWDIPGGDIEAGGKALYVDDADSWRYFVPAFMTWTLKNFRDNDSFVCDQTIYTFLPTTYDHAYTRAKRFENLTRFQCEVVCRFLRYMASEGEPHCDSRAAAQAVETYWGQFCADS